MIRVFPFIFVILWSSAFVTTKPIINNSDPFSALAFRFFFVALGFFIFSIFTKQKILITNKNLIQSIFSGVLFHGVYLVGVFYSVSIGMPTGITALIVTLQPILTNTLAGKFLNEKVSFKRWVGVILGFIGATFVLGFDIGSSLPIVGIIITTVLIKYIIKEETGHGFPNTLYALSKGNGLMSIKKTFSSVITAAFTVGFGGSWGLEGPAVGTTSAMGANITKALHLNVKTRKLMIGCGAAAAVVAVVGRRDG
jgi:drug/metabolite transporter (DMT)-like permease